MRKRIFEIIEVEKDGDTLSKVYDLFMMGTIIVSLIPLLFKTDTPLFQIMDYVTTGIFILDYCLRICTADYKLNKGLLSFIRYPFTFMALIDLLSILPTFLTIFWHALKLLKIFRLIRTFKVFRVFKSFRYSKNIDLILTVIKKQKDSLVAVCALAIGYIIIIALIIFNVEPDTFNSFFDALYWSTISLTTMGYGDIYAVSTVGKIITMISALFGIAVVALPAGLISAGFMTELEKRKNGEEDTKS